jgi:hypothetical protein
MFFIDEDQQDITDFLYCTALFYVISPDFLLI